jgi:DNA-binding beta-propeller fold protein YncE
MTSWYDIHTGILQPSSYNTSADRDVTALAPFPDDSKIAVCTSDRLEIVDVATMTLMRTTPLDTSGRLDAVVAVSPNGTFVVVGVYRKCIVFNSNTLEVVANIVTRQGEGANSVAFSPDGSMAYCGLGGVKVWSVS